MFHIVGKKTYHLLTNVCISGTPQPLYIFPAAFAPGHLACTAWLRMKEKMAVTSCACRNADNC